MSEENLFKKLSEINCSKYTEKKNGLTYLSWAHAWRIFKANCPDATYKIYRDENGNSYSYTESLGYMVHTKVTVSDETLEMWLPVMDGANAAMKAEPYTYTTRYGEKECKAATMVDINKTIMRCFVKNLGMFGLGINLYAGEDLPIIEPEPPKPAKAIPTEDTIIKAINEIKTGEELEKAYDKWQSFPTHKDSAYIAEAYQSKILELDAING